MTDQREQLLTETEAERSTQTEEDRRRAERDAEVDLEEGTSVHECDRWASDLIAKFDGYLKTDQAVRDYKNRFGKVINADQVKELFPNYSASRESRCDIDMLPMFPKHDREFYARPLGYR